VRDFRLPPRSQWDLHSSVIFTQSRVVVRYRRFRKTYGSHLQVSSSPRMIISGLLDSWKWDRYFVPKRLELTILLRCVKSQNSGDQHTKTFWNLLHTFSVSVVAMGKYCGNVWGCDVNSDVSSYNYALMSTNLISCDLDVRPPHENRSLVNKSYLVSIFLFNARTSM
jgi:hypothetical protein